MGKYTITTNFDQLSSQRKEAMKDFWNDRMADIKIAQIKELPEEIQIPVYKGLVAEMKAEMDSKAAI